MKKLIITEDQAKRLNLIENIKEVEQLDEIITKIPSDYGENVEIPPINVSYQKGGDIEIDFLGEISLRNPAHNNITEEILQKIGLIVKGGIKTLMNEKFGFSEPASMKKVAEEKK
jgi:hypothetical protein